MNGVLSQAFRSGTSTRITTIPTRLDTKRGERVVRWSDILQCYGDSVRFVMNGRDTVLFLADGDLENLIPLRIAYHPDVVLMVVAEDHLQEESSSTNATSSTTNGLGDPRSNPSSCHQLADTSSNQALVVRPRDHHSQTQTQNPHMDDQRDRQLLEMDPIRTLQEEVRQLRQQMQRQMEGVQQSVRDQHEVSQQSIQRQLEVVQQLVQDQDEESRQRMQQQLEGVQQSVQNQHEESQQRMQQQIDEGVQQLVLTHEESQQRIQRQLGGVQHLVQYQHEELQQRMQRHLEEVQQMVQDQHEESRQRMQHQVDDDARRSQQPDLREPIGKTTTITLPRMTEQLDAILLVMQDKDEREWKWEQRQQEMMDETQRRIDLVLLKIGQLETAQQESEEVEKRIEASLRSHATDFNDMLGMLTCLLLIVVAWQIWRLIRWFLGWA